MRHLIIIFALSMLSSCASISESMQLGGFSGALIGAAASAAGQAAGHETVKGKSILVGAEVGSLLGLGLSYIIHRVIENDRRLSEQERAEVVFGDLPPNPFEVPTKAGKRGGR